VSYYTLPWNDAKFTLQDKNKQTIEKKNGRVKCRGPFQLKNPQQGFPSGCPNYEAVTVKGITEIIEQRKPEPVLYVTDDPIAWKQYESMGC
jgi:hypothetical protein